MEVAKIRRKGKCFLCVYRPQPLDRRYGLYCHQCWQKVEAAKARAKERSRQRKSYLPQYALFAHWKGHTVGYRPTGSNGHTLYQAVYLPNVTAPDKLPKGKLVNLNVFCPGWTRNQVKMFKRDITHLKKAFIGGVK